MAYNSFINKQVGIQSPIFRFQKDRNNGAVLAGDGLGEFQFYGFDGTNYLLTSAITSVASGTIAANRIGSNLEFYTHPDSVTASTQRMVISNVGEVTINTPDTSIPALLVTNNGTGPNINLRTANATASNSPHIHFTRSRAGTADVQAGDDLGRLEFRGFQGGTAIDAADILSEAETVNGASVSGALQFRTRPTTYAAIATRMTVSADGNVTIATPVSGTALTISGGGESVLGTISLNATGTATTNINGTSNSGTVTIGNTSSGAVTIGCGTAGISVGTTANAHTSTFGSTNSTSATTVQSGSGALNVTSTNGALTINSGTGTLALSNDASNTTVNLATGAAVKTVQLGSTNTTSSLVLRSGTGNIVANTGLTVDSTGRTTNTVQPAFHAYVNATIANVTGNNTNYTIVFNTETFDQNSNYNNATGVFTAPITGRYQFSYSIWLIGLVNHAQFSSLLVTTQYSYTMHNYQPNAALIVSGDQLELATASLLVQMTAGDTASVLINVNGGTGTKVVDVGGGVNDPRTNFSGFLVC